MGFVTERLTANLAAVDSLFNVNKDVDASLQFVSLFTPAEVTNTSKVASLASEPHSRLLWDALQSPLLETTKSAGAGDPEELSEDRELPPLKDIGKQLEIVYENLYDGDLPAKAVDVDSVSSAGADTPRYPVAELAFLAKVTALLHAHLVYRLLHASTAVPPDVIYWAELESSELYTAYYLLETLPLRVYGFAKDFVASLRAQQPPHLRPKFKLFSDQIMSAGRKAFQQMGLTGSSTSLVGLGLNLRPPPTIFDLARREIKYKRERLERLREVQAACLGLLVEYGIGLGSAEVAHTAKTDVNARMNVVQTSLSRTLNLLSGVLDKVGKLGDLDPGAAAASADELRVTISSVSAESVPMLYAHAHGVYLSILSLDAKFERARRKYGRPPLLVRLWAPAVTGAIVTYKLGSNLALRWDDLVAWVGDLQDTARAFIFDWVITPLRQVYATVRHRETRLALLGSESLSSDIECLERMVVDFAQDHGTKDPAALKEIAERVKQGDLTLILQRYEQDIRSPLKSALSGDLIRSLLIQVQKTKVDMELAMAALDKLLRSNELNFAFLAVIPTLVIVAFLVRQSRRLMKATRESRRENAYELIRNSLREIERLLNRSDRPGHPPLPYKDRGLVLCELYLLRRCAASLPQRKNYRKKFIEDVRELEEGEEAYSYENESPVKK
ncbi:Nuclear control of ATPase protein 2 [Borealophlyctis nickersoniae]|nr:Nuclear control of ATPase protein 2 [Borealophlyctis nickersoniae]